MKTLVVQSNSLLKSKGWKNIGIVAVVIAYILSQPNIFKVAKTFIYVVSSLSPPRSFPLQDTGS